MIFGQILKSCRPRRIEKADENFANRLDLKDIKFPVKTGHSHTIEKNNSSALASVVMKIRNNIQSVYQKNVLNKNKLTNY